MKVKIFPLDWRSAESLIETQRQDISTFLSTKEYSGCEIMDSMIDERIMILYEEPQGPVKVNVGIYVKKLFNDNLGITSGVEDQINTDLQGKTIFKTIIKGGFFICTYEL